VVLNVSCNGHWRHGETWAEISDLIVDVLENLESEEFKGGWHSAGQDAWFSLSDQRYGSESQISDNYLRVSVNRSTGYGALIWGVVDSSPKKGGVFDWTWISDNPDPPDTDPRVVSDPGYPLFHDPRSAIPISRVRAAVEEFCRLGTGDRPECISWVRGHLNGQRLDAEPMVEEIEENDPFA
jgi:hypothetical protein